MSISKIFRNMSTDLSSSKIDWTYNETRMLKHMLEDDGMQFCRYFFRLREGNRMVLNWHHYVMEYTLQAVMDLKVNRLIINMPPRYTKTELAVVNFMSRSLARNPRSKFIHGSASGNLVHDNSTKVRDVIRMPEFQNLWPMAIRTDKDGKGEWFNEYGGGMLAVPCGGQVTGFGAGRMTKGEFAGAVIIDDPLKPADAFSEAKRSNINKNISGTFRSRLATEEVPIILIMQRIHDDDVTGHLLGGGTGDMWHHLTLPAYLGEDEINAPYPEEYTHGIKIDINEILRCLKTGEDYAF